MTDKPTSQGWDPERMLRAMPEARRRVEQDFDNAERICPDHPFLAYAFRAKGVFGHLAAVMDEQEQQEQEEND